MQNTAHAAGLCLRAVTLASISFMISVFSAYSAYAEQAENVVQQSEEGPTGWSGQATVTSDYVDRGVSNSDGKPAIQAGASYGFGGLYIGGWASNVDFDDGESKIELNGIVGYAWSAVGIDFDAAITSILYPGVPQSFDADLVEFSLSATKVIGEDVSAGVLLIATPGNAGEAGNALYAALQGEAGLPWPGWSVHAHGGRQWNQREERAGPDYHDWGLGLSFACSDHLSLSLDYADSNLAKADCPSGCGARLIASLTHSF
jgi:uncharacterized protein (TIGR02001 family)